MIDQATRRRLSQIVTEWNKAERTIKIAEMSNERATLTSITELRYAGRRLVDFLSLFLEDKENDQGREYLLIDALHNISRAKNYAIDAMIAKAGHDLAEVIEEHGQDTPHQIRDDIEFIKRIKLKIAETRADRASRDGIYDVIIDEELTRVFSIIMKRTYSLSGLRPRVKRKHVVRKPDKITAGIVAAGGLVSAILGILVAILS